MRTNLNGSSPVVIDPKKNEVNEEETFGLPLDISDIISVCREYSKLGWTVQNQIEFIMEIGIQEAVNNKMVNVSSLPHIKEFLQQIQQNGYFGEAAEQAQECIQMIEVFEIQHPELFSSNIN
jgi:hypothetical protein